MQGRNKSQWVLLITLMLVTVAWSASLDPAVSLRARINIDANWHFLRDTTDTAQCETIHYDDRSWQHIDVPHDWSIAGPYDANNPGGASSAYLPTGVGWYRKTIEIPEAWSGRQISVVFDGVFRNSRVWLNGQPVGDMPWGYMSFICDLTTHIRPGKNLLAVRVDNSQQPAARWYTGSGIYGHVHLMTTGPIRVAPWGIFVYTPKVTDDQARVEVETELLAHNGLPQAGRLEHRIISAEDGVLARTQAPLAVTDQTQLKDRQTLRLNNPRLWSPDHPNLYSLVTDVYIDDVCVDRQSTVFGVRSLDWDCDRGFILNGKPTLIRGMGNHWEMGCVGSAIPDDLLAKRLQMFKDMGCNALRTTHNPFPPVFYDLCDQLGLLVLDEFIDGWRRKASYDYGALYFKTRWKQDVETWVRRDRNHPSVFAWSIGNETGRTDRHNISNVIKQLDPTRPTTGSCVFEGVDVAGFNGIGEYPGGLEDFRINYPDANALQVEAPHTMQTRGYYRSRSWCIGAVMARYEDKPYAMTEVFGPGIKGYMSSYDNCGYTGTIRRQWKATLENPWTSGFFRWTGNDYLGDNFPIKGWPIRSLGKGIIDLAMIPKDHYYFYQSQWTDEPMIHLLPHWTHPGLEGRVIPVVAYSNGDSVELLLNGRSLGHHLPSELADFVWQVPYESGVLKAIAYQDGKAVAETSFRTASDPVQIQLTVDHPEMWADSRDVSLVTFVIADQEGVLVPDASDGVHVKVKGPVRLLGYENGDPLDVTGHRFSWRRAFMGMGRGFYQATDESGPIEVSAAAILAGRSFGNTRSVAIAMQRISLRGPLPDAAFAIHYTLDKTEPTLASLRYQGPFEIDGQVTVKAVVFRNQSPWIACKVDFAAMTKPGLDLSGVKMPLLEGPCDVSVVGRWYEWAQCFDFCDNGKVYRSNDRNERWPVASWTFDRDAKGPVEGTKGLGKIRWDIKNLRANDAVLTLSEDEPICLQVRLESHRIARTLYRDSKKKVFEDKRNRLDL
jgi:beta-galactosidase